MKVLNHAVNDGRVETAKIILRLVSKQCYNGLSIDDVEARNVNPDSNSFLHSKTVICDVNDIEMLVAIIDGLVDWFDEGTSLSNSFLILTPLKEEKEFLCACFKGDAQTLKRMKIDLLEETAKIGNLTSISSFSLLTHQKIQGLD
jgi:hypothetical protein